MVFALFVPLAFLAWLGLPSSALAQETPEGSLLDLTLDEAIGLALQNNRGLIDARLSRSLQELALDIAEDRYRPSARIEPSVRARRESGAAAEVSVSSDLRVPTGGRFSLSWSKPVAGRDRGSGTVTVRFSQPLLRGFGASIDTAPLRVARLGERIAVLSFRETIAGVVDSTIGAWRSLSRALRRLEIAEASLERAREQLAVNRKLIEAGQMAAREILQSEADIADQELRLVETRNGVTSANFALIDILDIDSATVIRPVEAPRPARAVAGLGESMETALRHSPGYARALLFKEVAEIDLEVAEDEQLWDLSLEADTSRGTGGGGVGVDYSAGLRLTIPLWERSPELGLRGAEAGVQQALRALAEERQSMGIAVRQAVYDLEVGLRRIDLARQALALAEEKLEIERSKLRQGLSSSFQLSRYEEDLVRAQNAEVDALAGYESALISLDRTLGTTLETWGIGIERAGR